MALDVHHMPAIAEETSNRLIAGIIDKNSPHTREQPH
jgi:hypothetical protein